MARVVLENIYKNFSARNSERKGLAPSVSVLRNINLEVQDGEFMVLVGPSGCGKSTLLRLIAGLEDLTAGAIWVGDRRVNDLPPKQRNIAMVFQSYALYPHLSVFDNLAFGLRRTLPGDRPFPSPLDSLRHRVQTGLAGMTRPLPAPFRYCTPQDKTVAERVQGIARMLQIESLLNRLPRELSGGQKQRVALGRAMARNPDVFLMDEPLSNLDAKLRAETRAQIVGLQRQLGTTTIYVTHDQVEAMTMGDRIAIMRAGEIQQVASPLTLYTTPANCFVAGFIGTPPMNFLPIQFKAPLLMQHDLFRLTLPEEWATVLQPYDGRSLLLGIRPEHLRLSAAATKNLPVQVTRVEALGHETYITTNVMGVDPVSGEACPVQARLEPEETPKVGDSLWLAMASHKLHFFDGDTQRALFPDVLAPKVGRSP